MPIPKLQTEIRVVGDKKSVAFYRAFEKNLINFDPLLFRKNVEMLPTEGPKITGGQSQYNSGDTVAINCTSAKSKPAATLRWFINDNALGPEFETEYSTTLHEDGLETSSLSLKFVAKDKHFVSGTMRLRCTASISRIYTMSNEEMFRGGRQQSSPLQITENGSKETPLKMHLVQNRRAPKTTKRKHRMRVLPEPLAPGAVCPHASPANHLRGRVLLSSAEGLSRERQFIICLPPVTRLYLLQNQSSRFYPVICVLVHCCDREECKLPYSTWYSLTMQTSEDEAREVYKMDSSETSNLFIC
ncbi:ig-like domain-containing protein [Caerostris extrusa]|uniref:Ig-like domain-containing protein n=1 Tax=Caerostris extrusa TaxID=172846 RepID=A0AAV4NBQ7_CAEEX|nr:ig-like domain-containing protein [Caerostris extrusa]